MSNEQHQAVTNKITNRIKVEEAHKDYFTKDRLLKQKL